MDMYPTQKRRPYAVYQGGHGMFCLQSAQGGWVILNGLMLFIVRGIAGPQAKTKIQLRKIPKSAEDEWLSSFR
jgi:hypothetical protein